MEEFHASSATLAPLSERMRPQTLEEFLGQGHIVRKGSALFRAITAGTLGSCIFFGPPGTGKTTLAGIIANQMQGNFVKLNAVSCGVQEVKEVISQAKRDLQLLGKKTYLLLDECHRFNKAQSDSMLEAIEKGYITFIGSTTENPFTSMTRAIVSRCQIFEFRALTKTDILALLNRALTDSTRGFGALNIHISTQALEILANRSAGDARSALSSLELAVLSTPSAEDNSITITKEIADECSKHNILATDTDMYYDMLSAFCKSLRGSDSTAALFWFARMMYAGVGEHYATAADVTKKSYSEGVTDEFIRASVVGGYKIPARSRRHVAPVHKAMNPYVLYALSLCHFEERVKVRVH